MPQPKDVFGGAGFSRKPLEDEELAQVRAMMHEVAEEWPTLKSAARMAAAAGLFARVLTVAAVLGGALAWAAQSGIFQ